MSTVFQFKQFAISQEHSALKLGTDAVLLGALTEFSNPRNILDIGTGTGILALMMAQKYRCAITAIDIDEGAILDAKENVKNSPWKEKITIIHGNIHDTDLQQKFDGIICNPPFFSNSLLNPELNKAIARHTITLTPQSLFHSIETLLDNDGKASIIIPFSEKKLFCETATLTGLYAIAEWLVFPKTNATSPNRCILQFAKKWQPFTQKRIAIRNDDSSYSDEFNQITRDFYAKLE